MPQHRLPRARRRGSARPRIMQIELACGMPQAGGCASAHTSCARASATAGRTQALRASLEPHWLGVCECALVCATRCCVSLGARCGVHPTHTHVLEAHLAGRYDCEVECGGATCEAKRRWRSVRGRRGRRGASLRANTTKLARPCAEARGAARARACARVCVCVCVRVCAPMPWTHSSRPRMADANHTEHTCVHRRHHCGVHSCGPGLRQRQHTTHPQRAAPQPNAGAEP